MTFPLSPVSKLAMRVIPGEKPVQGRAAERAPRTDTDTTDAALAAQGDVAAFERIYRRHGPRLFRLARRFLGADLAEDAVQDVFVQAWDRLSQFRGESLFGSWLHRVAINVLLRQAITARRIAQRMASTDVDLLPARTISTDTRMDVDAALGHLSEDLRAVVILHDLEGFGHREIADTLGLSVSASKMRLHRGRMQLREWLLP